MMAFRSWRTLLAVLVCLSLQACSVLAVDRVERYKDSEGVFAVELLDTIEPHATTHLWLLEHFGQPLYTTHGPNGAKVLTWQFVRQNLNRTALLGILRYSRTTEEKRYLHTVIDQDVVIRHWRDKHAHVDVDRVFSAVGLPRQAAPIEESLPLPVVPQKRHWTEPAGRTIAPLVIENKEDKEDTTEEADSGSPSADQPTTGEPASNVTR